MRFVFLNTKDTKAYLTTKTQREITKDTKVLRFVEELIRFVFLNTKDTKVLCFIILITVPQFQKLNKYN